MIVSEAIQTNANNSQCALYVNMCMFLFSLFCFTLRINRYVYFILKSG